MPAAGGADFKSASVTPWEGGPEPIKKENSLVLASPITPSQLPDDTGTRGNTQRETEGHDLSK